MSQGVEEGTGELENEPSLWDKFGISLKLGATPPFMIKLEKHYNFPIMVEEQSTLGKSRVLTH